MLDNAKIKYKAPPHTHHHLHAWDLRPGSHSGGGIIGNAQLAFLKEVSHVVAPRTPEFLYKQKPAEVREHRRIHLEVPFAQTACTLERGFVILYDDRDKEVMQTLLKVSLGDVVRTGMLLEEFGWRSFRDFRGSSPALTCQSNRGNSDLSLLRHSLISQTCWHSRRQMTSLNRLAGGMTCVGPRQRLQFLLIFQINWQQLSCFFFFF